MKGFKGFSKDWKCRDKQYEAGKTFEEPEAKLCEKGLHFCEHPLDVFEFYPPSNMGKFAEIDADEVSEERRGDKLVCKKLTVKAELSIKGMIEAAVGFVFDRANWTENRTSNKENDGVVAKDKFDAASATGYGGAASATGDGGAASATGDGGFASALGIEGRVKAALGNWITLAEWERNNNDDWVVKEVKSAKIDGEVLKPDVWYWLKNGQITVCEEMSE
jgi:hypothetical protein